MFGVEHKNYYMKQIKSANVGWELYAWNPFIGLLKENMNRSTLISNNIYFKRT